MIQVYSVLIIIFQSYTRLPNLNSPVQPRSLQPTSLVQHSLMVVVINYGIRNTTSGTPAKIITEKRAGFKMFIFPILFYTVGRIV